MYHPHGTRLEDAVLLKQIADTLLYSFVHGKNMEHTGSETFLSIG